MITREVCPQCGAKQYKKNGHIHTGKQNHKGKACGRAFEVYKGVIPPARHQAVTKLARKTTHVERFNCTLRQWVVRLARATLSFSKKLSNHIGAIRYFICHYNCV